MRQLKYFILLAVLAVPVAYSHAQVAIGVQVGPSYEVYNPPPICEFGYYPYYPYACAPYGYWGPEWFVGDVFIGAGPWYRFYYTHPVFWHRYYYSGFFVGHRDFDRDRFDHDRFRGREFHGFDHDRDHFDRDRFDRDRFRGREFHGDREFHEFHGERFHGGGERSHGGNEFRGGGGRSHGGNEFRGGGERSHGGDHHDHEGRR